MEIISNMEAKRKHHIFNHYNLLLISFCHARGEIKCGLGDICYEVSDAVGSLVPNFTFVLPGQKTKPSPVEEVLQKGN